MCHQIIMAQKRYFCPNFLKDQRKFRTYHSKHYTLKPYIWRLGLMKSSGTKEIGNHPPCRFVCSELVAAIYCMIKII